MHPILFNFGPITVYSYGFFLALSYIAATFVFWREGKRQGYQEEKLIDFSVASLVSAIVGGRLFYTLLNFDNFRDNPTKIFYFWDGGFAYIGSFLLVFLTGAYLVRKWKWSFFQVADFASLAALTAMFFADIGSFLSGNDFGKTTNLPWGVTFPFLIGKRHPTQIYAAILTLILLFALYRIYKKNLFTSSNLSSGLVFLYFLIFTSLARIFVEFFRSDSTYLLGLPWATLFSFVLAIVAILALYYYQFRDFRTDTRNFSRYILGINLRFRRTINRPRERNF